MIPLRFLRLLFMDWRVDFGAESEVYQQILLLNTLCFLLLSHNRFYSIIWPNSLTWIKMRVHKRLHLIYLLLGTNLLSEQISLLTPEIRFGLTDEVTYTQLYVWVSLRSLVYTATKLP